jgi:hypothetical protein
MCRGIIRESGQRSEVSGQLKALRTAELKTVRPVEYAARTGSADILSAERRKVRKEDRMPAASKETSRYLLGPRASLPAMSALARTISTGSVSDLVGHSIAHAPQQNAPPPHLPVSASQVVCSSVS